MIFSLSNSTMVKLFHLFFFGRIQGYQKVLSRLTNLCQLLWQLSFSRQLVVPIYSNGFLVTLAIHIADMVLVQESMQ